MLQFIDNFDNLDESLNLYRKLLVDINHFQKCALLSYVNLSKIYYYLPKIFLSLDFYNLLQSKYVIYSFDFDSSYQYILPNKKNLYFYKYEAYSKFTKPSLSSIINTKYLTDIDISITTYLFLNTDLKGIYYPNLYSTNARFDPFILEFFIPDIISKFLEFLNTDYTGDIVNDIENLFNDFYNYIESNKSSLYTEFKDIITFNNLNLKVYKQIYDDLFQNRALEKIIKTINKDTIYVLSYLVMINIISNSYSNFNNLFLTSSYDLIVNVFNIPNLFKDFINSKLSEILELDKSRKLLYDIENQFIYFVNSVCNIVRRFIININYDVVVKSSSINKKVLSDIYDIVKSAQNFDENFKITTYRALLKSNLIYNYQTISNLINSYFNIDGFKLFYIIYKFLDKVVEKYLQYKLKNTSLTFIDNIFDFKYKNEDITLIANCSKELYDIIQNAIKYISINFIRNYMFKS